ncbi:peptide deformylase [Candidatus Curtissbacteria bacterium RIFCSPHIGHO2_01_FULL_41_44]|uniref:Peptide deformylase n=1 Tax=Candidatus Curtissbacteria bacterium RIFCSPLOWO2_01_FULL_42_50 TaxID=1797730 RepID=A0A1F5H758_9BACT|nr:MAG: peptide deformylase [Candidatus Curtissbacteria bacterium RIFCSPHIGHO2_02_FULL_42_58]OGD94394.1 MAG: peptide deformylase [Candidatus Curtissbacteria bacterium RIFCSPHIGHO2_01_FULL_41_44]OGD97668.1 MAG: peptide deformylase [Candidatus Curtissbacteria bacterium RIFCSPHIGHO2_12_FULL_42_33]OGD99899.1 MAG: peptide deformylase [Candidatus Curtissbacteria bacterium RIFCSPLOWO2_01_FULL_42_50]OGE02758.1 MAG: peptide deformylase [Candidatus Curtissbacteria bacterium RIFCSPLOWO2_12_FULL_41_16]OGE
MVKPIFTIPDKRLRQKSEEIIAFDKTIGQIIADLTDTLVAQTDPPGLGLSAPQIGITKRLFVAKIRNKFKAFVNPQILKFSKKELALLEGCFSVPELYGHVVRPAEIDITACDRIGKQFKNHYKGLPARIIQHEVDHLNGVLFVDHVHNQNGKLFKVEKNKKGKEQLVEVSRLIGL